MPQVSIIVPCRNEERYTRQFLKCLLAQELRGISWEVIVADGLSDDGTAAIIQEYSLRDHRVRLIPNPRRIVSTGLNEAIRRAEGYIIVRMDVHTEYASDYIRQCVEVLEETGADNVGGAWRARGNGIVGKAIAAAFRSRFSAGGAASHREDYEGPVDTVYLGCWRKSTLEELGLFDEDLVRNQDDELNLRLLRKGGLIWQSRRIVSHYTPRNSVVNLFRQYMQYGFWKVQVIRKHHLPASWRHLVPGAFVLTLLGLPVVAGFCGLIGLPRAARGTVVSWVAVVVSYLAANILASVHAAARSSWRLLPLLPAVFATYHIAYGIGFLSGLMRQPLRRGSGQPTLDDRFSQLSR
jgi:glycosyltransferase involved in cell wall biosynthesis